ncbi:MAG: OmpA family protein [Deltaproteobacteria bacterium]|jgi:chemotaxis protein MotB|nr:OmpA family protein [Deltaproteobacteria bacterium]
MAARRPQEDKKPQDSTLVLFTSLTLILLTFFIMLTAKANFDEVKYGKVVDSVYETFGLLDGGLVALGDDQGLSPGRPSIGDPLTAARTAEPEMARLRALLSPELLDGGARIVRSQGQRIVSLSAGLLFAPGSAELTEPARETLAAFCRIMRDSPVPVAVEGHTDNQPPTLEGAGDNWDLSLARAEAVVDFFAGEGGLSSERLSAYGYASFKPAAANNSPANRARNNRVDLVLDFESLRAGALRGLESQERLFDFGGFEFLLPAAPGGEEEVY